MSKISKIAVPGVAEPYDIGTLSIPFGQVDSTSTDTAYTAQIEGITSLYDGVCVYLKNGVITSNKNGFTLNINSLGAKPVYDTLAAATRSGTVFNVDYTMLFVYNSSRVSGGCWDIFYGYNSDTTDLEEALTPLTGTIGTLTPMQVYNAIKSGKSVILQYMDDTYGLLSYTNFNVAESMNVIAANTIAYFNNTYVLAELWGDTTTNVWGFETTTLAQKQDIPTKLPNPNALTFTGAVTDSYDGSSAKTIEIPIGAAGKSAYQYAQDGGYTGTEAAFSEKLAQEQLTGTTGNLTPTQVYEAVSAGIPVKVQYTDSTYGLLSFTAFNVFESLSVIVSETIAYFNGLYILIELLGDVSGNTWGHMATTLAQKSDIPLKLPNPNALTFTGAAEGSYDGSEALSVEIPSGSGASEGSSQWKIIRDLTITENADRVDINKDNDGNTFALHEIHVFSYTQSYADSSEAYTFLLNGFWNVGDPYFYSGFKSTASSSDYYAKNHFIATMQNGFANIFQPWKAYIVGTNNNGDVFSFGDKYQTIESVSFVGKFIAGCRFILVGRVTL